MIVVAYQRLLRRVLASFEEPKEHIGRWVEADVTSIVVDTLCGFAYSSLARLLVADLRTLGGCDCGDASSIGRNLTLFNERLARGSNSRSRQDGSKLYEARHRKSLS
jgi:hypothetical protein